MKTRPIGPRTLQYLGFLALAGKRGRTHAELDAAFPGFNPGPHLICRVGVMVSIRDNSQTPAEWRYRINPNYEPSRTEPHQSEKTPCPAATTTVTP